MKYITGYRFGSLTLQSIDRENYPNNGKATLVCDCGNTAVFFMSVLASGHNTDCGCSVFTTIYFIQVHDYVKIGRCKTDGVRTRLSNLAVNCPYPAELIRTISGNRQTEQSLHRHFEHLHHRGEWYRFVPEMLTIEIEANTSAITRTPIIKRRPTINVRNILESLA